MLSIPDLKAHCDAAVTAADEDFSRYESIAEKYQELGLPAMDDASDLMFSNHVLCVLGRIRTGEYVDEMPEDLFSEVSQAAREGAQALLADAFSAQGKEPNTTEVLMLATHLEVAMQLAQQ